MMPGRRNNGNGKEEPEKGVGGGYQGPSSGQYGSANIGMWGQHDPPLIPGDGRGDQGPDKDQKLLRLQEMFKGQVDPEVVHMVLNYSEWNVDQSVERLLEMANSMPGGHRQDRGPSLKSVAETFASSSSVLPKASVDHPPMRPSDLGSHLRSRLPSVQTTDPSSGALPMLSPRTPNVAGLDFPNFPQATMGDESSIQNALDALDSYANSDISHDIFMSSFDSKTGMYQGSGMFDPMACAKPQPNTESYGGLPPLGRPPVGFPSVLPERSDMDQYSALTSGLDSGFHQRNDMTGDSVPYPDFYSQAFQPVHTHSLTPSVTSTIGTIPGNGSPREPVSPRTAFNNAIMTGNTPLDISNRRPVREDSKDSATSEASRTSDISHASEESVVDLSPGIMKKARHPKQFLRRQNISLDPQERESLEQLIEEVLIGGVDHGVIDSDDSYTSGDEDGEDGMRMKGNTRGEDGSKIAPSQLKVAAKHMKNLPPRFLKRLQAAQPTKSTEDGDEGEEMEDVVKDEQEVEDKRKKKRSKGLLQSLVDYVEDDVIVTDPEEDEEPELSPISPRQLGLPTDPQQSMTAPITTTAVTHAPSSPNPPFSKSNQPIILRPNVVNISDLDPDRVIHTPPRMPYSSGPTSRDQTPEPNNRNKPTTTIPQQTFSLDAPEFVPRSFHPINPPSQQNIASPVGHLRDPHVVPLTAYSFSPRSGSPYTVQSVGSPYPGRAGSPYHLGMGSSLSPQMSRRAMTGSPIAMVQVPTGKHSPIPPAFFIPKAPTTAAAASAVAMHGHAGLIPYPAYPAAHYPIPPGMRYMAPGYRPPFLPPGGAGQPRPPHIAYKYNHKDRLQTNNRPSSAPTVVPGTHASRMAANLSLNAKGKTTPKASTGSTSSAEGKSDKDAKEIKNLSTQLSKGSEEEIEPQQRVKAFLEQGKKLMVLLRGVPGSGKTHLAKELVHDGVVLSTDDFFVTDKGYKFDFGKISEAHEWNQNRAQKAVDDGRNPIIIDNTNTQAWEMKFYVALAIKNDYEVEIIEPDTPWKYRAKELAKRNKHGVTKENIQRMIDRFDHSVTVETIIASSEKIKAEVERKQRLAAAQQQLLQQHHLQQQQDSLTSANTEGTPVEEKKTKKKTRRGKGRKKKARLRELREAEANKGLENKEKTEELCTSEDESTPEREQSADKSSTDQDPRDKSTERKPSEASSQSSMEARSQNEDVESTDSKDRNKEPSPEIIKKDSQKEDPSAEKPDHEEEATSPEAKPVKDSAVNEKRKTSYASDDSESGVESYSEPSTAESQLSQASDDDQTSLLNDLPNSQNLDVATVASAATSRKVHGHRLMEKVKNTLVRNLKEQLNQTSGAAKAQLETLLEKYHNSPDVCAEIEEIIMEKMSDGMANKEVAEITSKALNLSLEDNTKVDSMETQQTKNLTKTDVNSIMHFLGQMKHPESCSDSDNVNDGNNNNQCLVDRDDPLGDEDIPKKDTAELEKAYWEAKASNSDPYTVGQVGSSAGHAKLASQSSDASSDQAWEGKPSHGAKPRRDRKRPYDRKRGKSQSEEFWSSGSCDLGDQLDGLEGESTLLLSPESTSSLTPSASPSSATEEGSRRCRKLSGKKRMAAQFSLPELEPGVKEQLMVQDWQLPDFSSKEVPFSVPSNPTPRATIHVETYTHPKDFAAVYRLVQTSDCDLAINSPVDEGFLRVCVAKGRNISADLPKEDLTETKSSIPRKLMIDRSCSTSDLEEQKDSSDIEFLQSCFSTVSREDLTDILQQCGGEVQWAANILLDAGYEYNEKPKPTEPLPVHRQAAVNMTLSSSSETTDRSSVDSGPLSLVQICHQALEPAKATTEEVQDQMVENSVRRLSSISEFRRQRSLSGEHQLHMTTETQLGSASLGVVEDEADVFYSPSEGPASPRFPASVDKSPMQGVSEITLNEGRDRRRQVPRAAPQASDMVLTLSPALADQLIALFGPVGFHISSDSLSPSDLGVKLNRKAAKQLHRRWALTLKEKFNTEEEVIQDMIKQDEEFAKKLQAEEEAERHRQEELAAAINVGRSHHTGTQSASGPLAPESLKEIMEEEMAIELSKKEYKGMMQSLPGSGKEFANSIATKMKRQKIMELFPKLDPIILEDVYKASGYNMSKTVAAIQESLGMNQPVQNVWTPEAIQAYEDAAMRKAMEASLQEEWLGTEEGADEADSFQAVDDPQYQDIRAEASTHYRLRHECFQKAQEAYKRGLKSVASFYSQQGHIHTQKLKEANRRAAEKILELRNDDVEQTNTIDLHGLHVDEALRILDEIIVKRERELRQRPDKRKCHLYVVTGRGSHSRGGKARIRPAVIDLLTRRGYNYTEGIPGMMKVMMKYRDDL